jgi:hypothetical protein
VFDAIVEAYDIGKKIPHYNKNMDFTLVTSLPRWLQSQGAMLKCVFYH